MQAVTYPGNLVLHWDDTLTPGDLITAYEKGYHVLCYIKFRGDDETPLVYYTRVVSAAGAVVKSGPELVCDASYVHRLTKTAVEELYQEEVNKAAVKRDNLLKFAAS